MAKEYLQYLILTAVNIIVSLILVFGFVTFLNKASYAEYGYVWTVATLLLLFINLGHKDTLFKYTSQRATQRAKVVLGSSIFICGSLAILLLSFWQMFSSLMALALLAVTGLQLVNMLATFYRGQGQYGRDVIVVLSYRSLWLLFFIIAAINNKFVTANDVFVAGALASVLVFFISGGWRIFKELGFEAKYVTETLRNSTVKHFFIIELVTVSFMKVDVLLLNHFDVHYHQLAEYFFSVQVFEAAVLMLLPISFLFFNQYNKSLGEHSALGLFIKSFMLLMVVFAIGLIFWGLFGNQVLSNLFPDYTAAYELILILTITLLPNALNALFSAFLFANHRETEFIKVSLFGLSALVFVDVVVIPYFGVTGAAYGRLISECFISILLLTFVVKVVATGKTEATNNT